MGIVLQLIKSLDSRKKDSRVGMHSTLSEAQWDRQGSTKESKIVGRANIR